MVWALFGLVLTIFGGFYVFAIMQAILRPDAAKVMGIEVTSGLVIFTLILASLAIVGGFSILMDNLLLAASVLQ